jgi:signal peptidase I
MTAVLGLLAAFALLVIVIPALLGTQTYTVLTGSMQPGMPPGTLVGVRETPIEQIRVGDVITYQLRPGEPEVVTHRVVGVTMADDGTTTLTTRGDANNVSDPPVLAVQVRGVVVYAVPFLGYPGLLVGGTSRGIFVLILGVAIIAYGAIVLISDVVRSRRRRSAARASSTPIAVGGAGGDELEAHDRGDDPGEEQDPQGGALFLAGDHRVADRQRGTRARPHRVRRPDRDALHSPAEADHARDQRDQEDDGRERLREPVRVAEGGRPDRLEDGAGQQYEPRHVSSPPSGRRRIRRARGAAASGRSSRARGA